MRIISPFVAAALAAMWGDQSNALPLAPKKPTGGHRAKGYTKTKADHQRLQAAADRRARRAEKRWINHLSSVANNPCITTIEQVDKLLGDYAPEDYI